MYSVLAVTGNSPAGASTIMLFFRVILKKHTHGRRVVIFVLAGPDRPEETEQKSKSDHKTEGDQNKNDFHGVFVLVILMV